MTPWFFLHKIDFYFHRFLNGKWTFQMEKDSYCNNKNHIMYNY